MDDRTQRAIAHLFEALMLLACVRDPGDTSSVPIHIGPANAGHTVHVTAKTAEAIADAVDSMNDCLGSETVEDDKLRAAVEQAQPAIDALLQNDEASVDRRLADLKARAQDGNGEVIPSGEFSAAAVAQCYPDLYANVTDAFDELDPIDITDKVIRDRQADLPDVAQLLDELFGDIPYPYADEDVPLPHDQAQMDSLTAEVENHLKDGGE
ncbi:hypothetical protein [Streptomyces africanus]|uniref:hypothetical protein n=1 Tax=Streptomyces africanus TaxID=231024 RepID=UPI000A3C0C37|nr:hypothetical protein [Streptomyces africanus]